MFRVFTLFSLLMLSISGARADDKAELTILIEQLNGKSCAYEFRAGCQKREVGLLERIGMNSIRYQAAQCSIWAIDCLKDTQGTEAVPTLLEAIKTHSNLQTCDGVIPVRTKIVMALQEIGDKRAIPALEEYSHSDAQEKLSEGASGCAAQIEDKTIAQKALVFLKK